MTALGRLADISRVFDKVADKNGLTGDRAKSVKDDMTNAAAEVLRIKNMSPSERLCTARDRLMVTKDKSAEPMWFSLENSSLLYSPNEVRVPDPVKESHVRLVSLGKLSRHEAHELVEKIHYVWTSSVAQHSQEHLEVLKKGPEPAAEVNEMISKYGEDTLIRALLKREDSILAKEFDRSISGLKAAVDISRIRYLTASSGAFLSLAPMLSEALAAQFAKLKSKKKITDYCEGAQFSANPAEIVSRLKDSRLNSGAFDPSRPVKRPTYIPDANQIALRNHISPNQRIRRTPIKPWAGNKAGGGGAGPGFAGQGRQGNNQFGATHGRQSGGQHQGQGWQPGRRNGSGQQWRG